MRTVATVVAPVVNEHANAERLAAEERAIARAQAGDPAALEPVLAAHAEALFSTVLLPRLGDRAQAEDLLKDTFVTALEKIRGFAWQGRSLFFWLRRIALHKLIDLKRRQKRGREVEDELLGLAAMEPPPPSVDDRLIAEEDRQRARRRIDEVMAELPPRYARAIRLRLIEDRPRTECAATLAVELGTFDVLLFRAVRAFRQRYGATP